MKFSHLILELLLIEADASIRLNAFYQPKIRMLYFTTSFL